MWWIYSIPFVCTHRASLTAVISALEEKKRHLRKKSFFARFLAHNTEKDKNHQSAKCKKHKYVNVVEACTNLCWCKWERWGGVSAVPEDSDALDNFGLLKSSLSLPAQNTPMESKKDFSQTAFKVLNCLSLMPKRRDTGRINLQCCYLTN